MVETRWPDAARRIDAVCRRLEVDWRVGKAPATGDYLGEVAEEGRPALQAELVALEQELRQADETIALSQPGPIAEAPTIAPSSPPTAPMPSLVNPAIHEEATVPPRDQATIDFGPIPPPDVPEPARVRYFGD
jgi:hypothetical protein